MILNSPERVSRAVPNVIDNARTWSAEDGVIARRLLGSGLGLAIVKQAAEARGGFATAANAPDGGAVLRISFGPPQRAGRSGTDMREPAFSRA